MVPKIHIVLDNWFESKGLIFISFLITLILHPKHKLCPVLRNHHTFFAAVDFYFTIRHRLYTVMSYSTVVYFAELMNRYNHKFSYVIE